MQKILITGANGLVGNLLFAHLAAQPELYDVFGTDLAEKPTTHLDREGFYEIPRERFTVADIADFEAMQQAVKEMDVVVHLAADANGFNGWESVLQNNIIGTHNLFESCRLAGVKRIVFASTNQVVFGYRMQEPYKTLLAGDLDKLSPDEIHPIQHTQPVRPLNDYACSKVYGEALAHMYAYTHGISCLCLRLGWVTRDDSLPVEYARALWCSHRDVVQYVEHAINAPESLRFDIFFAASNNLYNFVDISHTREVLGYTPQDGAH